MRGTHSQLLLFLIATLPAVAQTQRSLDDIVTAYVQALGGQKAIDNFQTRELKGSLRIGTNATFYWSKPDKVLLIDGKAKTGFDGSSGWTYNKRKKVHRLPKGAELRLEIDANPLRYAALKQMYPEISVKPPGPVTGKASQKDIESMDILIAPNALGQTTFYFDSRTHLLSRIEEKGESSAYFETTVEFLAYRPVDGVQFPFNIVHRTTDKGAQGEDLHVKSVKNNLSLNAEIFSKPQAVVIISGGKR